MAKNNKPATAYAKPHAMDGGPVKDTRVNRSKLETLDPSIGALSKSAGNEPIKTTGIKIRGTGAATKGTIARGPMG
jgi:hypothetical protein